MTDQPVEIVEYDPVWQARFYEQQARLSALLRPWLAAPVEHIGSTAVKGLAAKPVVDVLAPVRNLDASAAAVPLLGAEGWWFWPDDPYRSYRLWFLRPRPEARTHHLHLIGHEDPHARALIAFRNALRSDPTLRRQYAALKMRLSHEHRENRNAYTNAKAEFVQQVLRAVGVTPLQRDPLPE